MSSIQSPALVRVAAYPRLMVGDQGERRWAALDGLRGVAVLMVLVDHSGLIPGAHPNLGAAGVTIFFVLSGFLITNVIVGTRERGEWSMRRFLLARVVRLMPALLVMEAVMLAWWLVAGRPFGDVGWEIVATTLYMANMFPGGVDDPLAHTWSLAIEEQFYLLWPLVLPLVLRARSPILVIGAAVAGSIMTRLVLAVHGRALDLPFDVFSLPSYAFALLLGGFVAIDRLVVAPGRAQCLGVVIGLGVIAAMVGVPAGLGPIVIAFAAAFVLTLALPGVGFLEVRWLRFVGRVSYALYLWHWPVLVLTGQALGGVSALPALVLSFVLAVASTLWLEEPLRRRWRARRTAAAAPVVVRA